jgi:hypothetical protein
VRYFAKSAGRLAKNDPIDAAVIAWFGGAAGLKAAADAGGARRASLEPGRSPGYPRLQTIRKNDRDVF